MTEADLYSKLGELVRAHRERLGRTQLAVAEATGLSRASIANIEKGRQRILLHQLYALAAALELKPTTLLPQGEKSQGDSARPTLRSSVKLSAKEREDLSKLVNSLSSAATEKDR